MKLIYYFFEFGGELFNHITGAYRHPPTYSEREIAELYQSLYEFIADIYDGGILAKHHVKRGIKIMDNLSLWCILRQYMENEEIEELTNREREAKFNEIMESSDRHRCLKVARIRVLEEAQKLGLIKTPRCVKS